MDIDTLQSTLVSLTLLPEELRSMRENLRAADVGQRTELVALLSSMERDLRSAKVTLARELGFAVCTCCWPPEVLAFRDCGESHCAGNSLGQSAAAAQPSISDVPVLELTRR